MRRVHHRGVGPAGHRRLLLGRKARNPKQGPGHPGRGRAGGISVPRAGQRKNLHLGRQLGHRAGHLPVLSPPAAHCGVCGQRAAGKRRFERGDQLRLCHGRGAEGGRRGVGAYFKPNRPPGKRLLPAGIQGHDGPAPHHEKIRRPLHEKGHLLVRHRPAPAPQQGVFLHRQNRPGAGLQKMPDLHVAQHHPV